VGFHEGKSNINKLDASNFRGSSENTTILTHDLELEFQKMELNSSESKILVLLMTRGSSTASDISRLTGISRTDTYHYISELLSKGVVLSSFTKPQRYHALAIDKAIDCLLKSRYDNLKTLLGKRNQYQDMINTIINSTQFNSSNYGCYQVVVGLDSITSRIKKMLDGVSHDILLHLDQKSLYLYQFMEYHDEFVKLVENNIPTILKSNCKNVLEYLYDEKVSLNSDAVNLTITRDNVPLSFGIIDSKELIILLDSDAESFKQKLAAFYTDFPPLVSMFKYLFTKIS
jgi:sugar-specific transcriptional regulator TrmB